MVKRATFFFLTISKEVYLETFTPVTVWSHKNGFWLSGSEEPRRGNNKIKGQNSGVCVGKSEVVLNERSSGYATMHILL